MASTSETGIGWDTHARSLFEELMRKGPPDALRDSATVTVAREAERSAVERGASLVEGNDVARACLRTAPPAFRLRVAASLSARGFDVGALGSYAGGAAPRSAADNPNFDSEWDAVHERIVSHRDEVLRLYQLQGATGPLRVLDLACGTGKHLLELARDGHRCHGIELQQWKVDKAARRARELGVELQLSCGDLTQVEVGGGFDLVLCLYAMSVMRSDAEVRAAFAAAKRALAPNGLFVFNVINQAANADPTHSMYRSVHVDQHLRDHTVDDLRAHLGAAGLALRSCTSSQVMGVADLDLFVAATHAEAAHGG